MLHHLHHFPGVYMFFHVLMPQFARKTVSDIFSTSTFWLPLGAPSCCRNWAFSRLRNLRTEVEDLNVSNALRHLQEMTTFFRVQLGQTELTKSYLINMKPIVNSIEILLSSHFCWSFCSFVFYCAILFGNFGGEKMSGNCMVILDS